MVQREEDRTEYEVDVILHDNPNVRAAALAPFVAEAAEVSIDQLEIQKNAIRLTVNQDRPLWPLSSYGPAKYVPNVIQGLDESSEELRFKAFTAAKSGTMQEYVRSLRLPPTVCLHHPADEI